MVEPALAPTAVHMLSVLARSASRKGFIGVGNIYFGISPEVKVRE